MKTLTSLFLTFFAIAAFSQSILVVDNNEGAAADYTNLQDAFNAAEPGDFVYVVPSSDSYGNADIEKELHIRGLGHLPLGTNGLSSRVNSLTFKNDCGNSSVSGLKADNNFNSFVNTAGFNDNVSISNCFIKYLKIGGNNWTLEGNIIDNNQISAHAINVDEFENTTIHNNIIRQIIAPTGTQFYALNEAAESTLEFNNIYILEDGRMMSECTNLEIQNSIILSLKDGDNLNFQGSTGWSFNNCLSYNYNGFSVPLTGGGANNLEDTDPQFENLQNGSPLISYSNNYNPAAGSPLISAASDGDNIGIYNENFDFDQRGHAIDIPYITNVDILNPSVAPEESLEINFSAFGN